MCGAPAVKPALYSFFMYNYYMRNNRKRPFKVLLISLLFLFTLLYLVFNFPPSYKFQIASYQLPITTIFFMVLTIFFSTLFIFIFKNTRRGVLMGIFLTSYVYIRYLELTHPLFFIALIGIFLALELVFTKKQ